MRVWFHAGQSNCNGEAESGDAPASLVAPNPHVKFSYHVQLVSGVIDEWQWTPLQPRLGIPRKFGPELSFGAYLAKSQGSAQGDVAIIKYGVSGSSLATEWVPSAGLIYPLMRDFFNAALASLAANFPGPIEHEGLSWTQGETDAGFLADSLAYQPNFNDFWTQFKLDFGANLKLVIYQLRYDIAKPFVDNVRAAEAAIAAATPRAGIVNIDDVPNALYADMLHLTADGQIPLGDRGAILSETL